MRALGLQLAAVLVLIAAVSGGSQAEVIDDILGSLSRAASFLERQHEQINLDGVLGYFMMQGEYTTVPSWKPGPELETRSGAGNQPRPDSCMKHLQELCSFLFVPPGWFGPTGPCSGECAKDLTLKPPLVYLNVRTLFSRMECN